MNSVHKFASGLQREIRWYGSPQKVPVQVSLRAGTLSMIYEYGTLRYILNGNEEIIRKIYPAVRDKEWLNIQQLITNEKIEVLEGSFNIRYTSLFSMGEIKFRADCIIEGKADSSITFSMQGTALSKFLRNRIGLCILHPVKECTGIPCTIVHSDKSSEILHFPDEISPHQPFTDITSMIWKTVEGENVLDLTGDIFETEDQRNWADASFKTYSTPLSLPHPVIVNKGDRVFQKVELRSRSGEKKKSRTPEINSIIIHPDITFRIPSIGIGRSSCKEPLTVNEIEILRSIPFRHYRIDLYLFENTWKVEADICQTESRELGYPLELALFFGESAEKEADDFIKWSISKEIAVSVIHIFHRTNKSTPEWLIKIAVPKIRKHFPDSELSCGTNCNFVQLNRNRIKSDLQDTITFSIHPQEHASDNLTLIENIEAQRHIVESAIKSNPGKKICVSPVTLKRRFNANIENFEVQHKGSKMPVQVDYRQMSLFGAIWTVGSLKRIVCAGADRVTYYETKGERGIIQGDLPSGWSEIFFATNGMVFPSFFIFKYLMCSENSRILKSESNAPLKTDHLILIDGSKMKMILVNYTPEKQKVEIPENMTGLTIKHLHDGNFADAVSDVNWLESGRDQKFISEDHLVLEPYSVSFLNGRTEIC